MDIREQQQKLYSDPYFGCPRQGWKNRLFQAFTKFSGVNVGNTDGDTLEYTQIIARISPGEVHVENSAAEIQFDIFRNGSVYSQLLGTQASCRNYIISLSNLHPDEDWSFERCPHMATEIPVNMPATSSVAAVA